MSDLILNGTVEYKESPSGVDKESPLFGWQLSSERKGAGQRAYRIMVYREEELVWDSKRAESARSFSIPYAGVPLEEQSVYTWQVQLWMEEGSKLVSPVYSFETGIKEGSWVGSWIGCSRRADGVMPVFRRYFTVAGAVKRARLYICSKNPYEIWINGKRAGEEYLEPAWTSYEKTLFYTVYDIAGYLKAGENGLGIFLGNGMEHIEGRRYAKFTVTGGAQQFIVQVNLEYENGIIEKWGSDKNFHMSPGPVTYSCVYGGEDYDGRKALPGFSEAHYTEDGWEEAAVYEKPAARIISRINPPVRIKERYHPVRVVKISDTSCVCDFGTNFSGWVKLEVRGERGCTVRVVPGELLRQNGEVSQEFTGEPHYYQYILRGNRTETFVPKFTFYGLRYAQIEGALPEEFGDGHGTACITGIEGQMLYTDMQAAGNFECSVPLWNSIHQIILQAMKSNAKSVLTDCPHREKLGWLEETHLMGPSLMYNFHMHGLYEKLLSDIRDSQCENGMVPSIAPEFTEFRDGFRDSPEWGSAAIVVPWYIYKKYGDIHILRESYSSMVKYAEYLNSRSEYNILHHGLGDWCDFGINPPFSQNTPISVTATAVYYYDLLIMEKVSRLLGKNKDLERYTERRGKVKAAFNREFLDKQGQRYVNGSQTANAMALYLEIPEPDYAEGVLDCLIKDIRIRNNHTTGGDVGFPFILRALAKHRMDGIVSDMAVRTDNPSYGFQVVNGATSLCEEWDGNMPGKCKNSQNHFMMGSIEEWFYGSLAGFKEMDFDTAVPVLHLEPFFDRKAEWVNAWHEVLQGRVRVRWERREGSIELKLSIPANLRVKLVLRQTENTQLTESHAPLAENHRILSWSENEQDVILYLDSGSYDFEIQES